ncbi:Plastid-lipid associated protein PAP / fibrillin family protein [Perilla frutescens var. hirtella]|uniref:Plastid-lipid associated protein PAP / fibrillin family protein n=1 Tax=Perilla frutescens var. hirtella TaxID=608512 RepID=A0AAD4JIY9_PERFH|nr:Plastid-lipid associated protein PAP / fibrillin family protein [Perilla frutescens var. hirtella]
MASVLHPPLPLSHHRTSSSISASTSVTNFPPTHKFPHSSTLHRRSSCDFKNDVICRSSSGEVTFIEPPQSPPSADDLIGSLKIKLLSAVSGLNRGLAASEDDLRKADDAAKELESAGGPVDLSADLDKLQGRWKLIYSSAFSSRTLGGSRPGPPTGRLLPITLGQVFQRIDIFSKDFDNIVELELGAPWPLPPLEVTATLAHKFELIGTSGIKIIFDKTTVKTTGNLSQLPPLDIPRIPDGLRPPSNTGSGEFEVTYLDSETRVTRGDRGELRVFVIA